MQKPACRAAFHSGVGHPGGAPVGRAEFAHIDRGRCRRLAVDRAGRYAKAAPSGCGAQRGGLARVIDGAHEYMLMAGLAGSDDAPMINRATPRAAGRPGRYRAGDRHPSPRRAACGASPNAAGSASRSGSSASTGCSSPSITVAISAGYLWLRCFSLNGPCRASGRYVAVLAGVHRQRGPAGRHCIGAWRLPCDGELAHRRHRGRGAWARPSRHARR